MSLARAPRTIERLWRPRERECAARRGRCHGTRFLLLAVLPLVLVPIAFVAVLESGTPAPLARARLPHEPYAADHCTWYCHNHGCRHAPALPSFLAGDEGLFGATIDALHEAGRGVSSRDDVGYGAANIALFCLAWPGAIYALYLVAVRQRLEIAALSKGRRG